jgi:hypothetical protein
MGTNVSQIFEEVNYIPLETNKESIFGKIDQLYVTNRYFIILDHDTNCILFFFKDGKFHCKIKGGTASKTDFPTGTRFFTVDKEKSELSFKIGNSKIAVFDFDGKKIREDSIYESYSYYNLSQKKIVHSYFNLNQKNPTESITNELFWQLDKKIYKNALPYAVKQSPIAASDLIGGGSRESAFYENAENGTVTYFRPYDYNIYQLNSDSLWINYTFILPQNISLPGDFRSNPIYYGRRINFLLRENKELVYNISHFYKLGNLLFFRFGNGNANINNSFIFSLQTSTLFAVDHIASDSSNYFLPIFLSYGHPSITFANANFLTTDGTYIYTTAPSLDMFEAKNVTANKHIQYSGSLKSYFDKRNKDDNPVIIQIKPR